jgi:hypothetical protein
VVARKRNAEITSFAFQAESNVFDQRDTPFMTHYQRSATGKGGGFASRREVFEDRIGQQDFAVNSLNQEVKDAS